MNKLSGVLLVSLVSFVGIYAEGYNLDQMRAAIKDSDVARVKTLWRRIDSAVESSAEKKQILATLIKESDELAQDSKANAPVASVGRDYKKIAGGSLLVAGAFAGILHHQPLVPFFMAGSTSAEKTKGAILFIVYMGMSEIGGRLIRSGLGAEAGQENIAGSGRSKAAMITAYFEDLLHELEQETRNS